MAMVVTPVQRTPARRGLVGSQGTSHGCLAAVPQNLAAFVLSKWRGGFHNGRLIEAGVIMITQVKLISMLARNSENRELPSTHKDIVR